MHHINTNISNHKQMWQSMNKWLNWLQNWQVHCIDGGRVGLLSPAHPKDCHQGSGLDSVVSQPIHEWKWCLMLPEPLFHSLSMMNRGNVFFEYARVVRVEKNPLMEKPAHLVDSGSQLTSCFGKIMLLNLDLTNWIYNQTITPLPLHLPLFLPWCTHHSGTG